MRRAVLSAASKDFFRRKLPSPSSIRSPCVAQFAGQSQRGGVQVFAQRRNEGVRLYLRCRSLVSLGEQGQHQPVLAHGKADARRSGSADGISLRPS